jgi:hypothetical protein
VVFYLPAQDIVITGSVINHSDQKQIAYSVILIKGTKVSTTSDENGCFSLTVRSLPVSLVVYQYGFHTLEIAVTHTASLLIQLKPKAVQLQEITIVSKRIDTIQQKSNSVYLGFEFYDNLIVALINKGNAFNYIQLIDEKGDILKEKKVPEGVEKLFVDCFGNIQLVTKNCSYQFYYDYVNINYLDKIPASEFYSKLVPCQCVLGNYVYFKEIYHKQLKNRYFFISKNKITDRKIICEICEKDKVERFNYDYDLNYFLNQRRKGTGYAMTVDEMTSRLDELRENVPLTTDYLFMMQPVQSELLKRDSALLLLDYSNRVAYTYNFLGGLIKKDSIRLTNLLPGAVIDKDRNRLYLVSENNGSTSLFEYKSGLQLSKTEIEDFKFIRNLRCRDGVLYFLYRDLLEEGRMKIYSYRL